MNENLPSQIELHVTSAKAAAASARGTANLLWFGLPLAALILACVWLVSSPWLSAFNTGAPPVEKLTFERTILDGEGIHVQVRAGGSESVTIAQVAVDDAFWSFKQEPSGPIDRLSSAWLHIPYPWVLGEKHEVKVLSRVGTAFVKTIDVAVATPQPQVSSLGPQALLGTFVGIVPVVIGMLFYPALRSISRESLNFVLALTVGLLLFLFIDTLEEALESANRAAASFQGTTMVLLVVATAFLLLFAGGRRQGAPTGIALAAYIAFGIGLHNFGEGLAIGAAFSAGVAGLGTFLVLGFTLHNVTEGIGIVAPLADGKPAISTLAGLAFLAGAPAIPGVWLGSLSYSPQWTALALAIGAGAILQVIVEVGGFLMRRAGPNKNIWLMPSTIAGMMFGVLFMYITAMLVKV